MSFPPIDDRTMGHRCGAAGERIGAYQYPSLGASGVVIEIPDNQIGEYVTLQWIPVVSGAVLYYGFFDSLVSATAGFDLATTSTTDLVPTAPSWIERGEKDVMIPRPPHTFLRLQSSTGVGRCIVASSDRHLGRPE